MKTKGAVVDGVSSEVSVSVMCAGEPKPVGQIFVGNVKRPTASGDSEGPPKGTLVFVSDGNRVVRPGRSDFITFGAFTIGGCAPICNKPVAVHTHFKGEDVSVGMRWNVIRTNWRGVDHDGGEALAIRIIPGIGVGTVASWVNGNIQYACVGKNVTGRRCDSDCRVIK